MLSACVADTSLARCVRHWVYSEQDSHSLFLLKKFTVQWGGRGSTSTRTHSKMSEQGFVVVESKREIGWVTDQDARNIQADFYTGWKAEKNYMCSRKWRVPEQLE